MATPKNWVREGTREDDGYLHSGSIDKFRGGSYAETALDTNDIEKESYWSFSMFHGPSYSKSMNQEFHRPLIRTSTVVNVTNYMTQSRDTNKLKGTNSSRMFLQVIDMIYKHEDCCAKVRAILGYMIVQNEVTDYLTVNFSNNYPEVMDAVTYFESRAKGNENSDNWTGKVRLRVPKYAVHEYLDIKKSEYYKLSARLKNICVQLFGSAEGVL